MTRCIGLTALTFLATTGSVSAYQVRKSASGAPIRWSEGTIDVAVALDDAPQGISPREAASAAEHALGTYVSALSPMSCGVAVRVENRGKGDAAVDAGDGVATVVWVSSGWDDDYDPNALAVTVSSYDPTSGRIHDADIVVNTEHRWTAGEGGCDRAFDLQSVLTHEIGHLFGLAHDTDDVDATMYPSAAVCETKKRDLDESDVQGLEYLYVESESPPEPLACSAAPGRRGRASAAAWLVLGGLAIALRRRRAAAVTAAAVALFAAVTPASATTMRRLDLMASGKSAAVVARGTVASVASRQIGGRVYTDAVLAVSECLKGACGRSLTIRQLGGEVDGEATWVEGSVELRAGGEVVVMLRERRDGAFSPVGMAQGVYRVERDARGAVQALVRDTRDLVLVDEGSSAPVRGRVERVKLEELERALQR